MKATLNDKGVDIEITDKAVIIDTGSDIIGFDLQAIRAVRKRDNGEIVIAYSMGAELKSITIKPLNDSDRANLLLALTKKEGGSQSPVSNQVIDDEFERLYQKWKNRLERELQLALEGKYKLDEKERGEFSDETAFLMPDILRKRYNADPGDLPLNHDETPYEFQVCSAKIMYLSHLYQLIDVMSDDSTSYPDEGVSYFDPYGFTLEDYEDLFRYYGIEVPTLPEEARKKVKERWVTEIVTGVPAEEGEEVELPADYKTWFREKD